MTPHTIAKVGDGHRPAWQLPPGVSRGTWDYVSDAAIATEYDAYHADHPLLRLDQVWVADRLERYQAGISHQPVLIDLGCGTGRAMMPWIAKDWRVIGIDLSRAMLSETRTKCLTLNKEFALVHANLAELDWMREGFADAAICLYSSIGMIRGRRHRHALLGALRRALRPGGLAMIHVHNRGAWLPRSQGYPDDSWFPMESLVATRLGVW